MTKKIFTLTAKSFADRHKVKALEGFLSTPEVLAECEKRMRNYFLYGTTHPETTRPLPPEPTTEDEHTVPF